MDSRTIKALEFGKVLEHLAGLCVSEAGRRVSLGLFPLRDADAVNAAHTLFDEVRTWSAHSGFRLSDFPDLEGLFPHLEKAAVSPSSAPLDADALWALRETLLQGRKAAQSINENGAMWPSLRDLVASMPLPEMTLSALSRCLGDDGLIKDESSPELMLVRGELRRLHLMCLRKVKDFAVQYNIAQYLQDDYMTLASDRYVLPLKSNFKGRIQGIIHDYSNTGETCYFEPLFLVEQNNRLQELKREEREEERKVLRYLTGIVQNELPFIRSAWDLLSGWTWSLPNAGCGLVRRRVRHDQPRRGRRAVIPARRASPASRRSIRRSASRAARIRWTSFSGPRIARSSSAAATRAARPYVSRRSVCWRS